MTITLRIILIISSILSFILCIKKMRQAKLQVTNSIIWMIGSIVLILMSIFSDAVAWISTKLGFMAPVNFVFFIMIVFLLIQVFANDIRTSIMNEKIKNIDHYIALKEKEREEEKRDE